MRCPPLPDSSENSGPAREKRISASPALVDAPDPRGLRARAGAHVARHRAASIGLEPREQRVEIAPMDAFGGQLRFAVGQRRERAITERGDEREDGERDQELDQREAARVCSSSFRRPAPGSPSAGRERSRARAASATTISILRNAGLGVPDTVSRHTKFVPACAASPLRAPGAGQGVSSCADSEPVLGDPQRERALLQ